MFFFTVFKLEDETDGCKNRAYNKDRNPPFSAEDAPFCKIVHSSDYGNTCKPAAENRSSHHFNRADIGKGKYGNKNGDNNSDKGFACAVPFENADI